MPFEIAPQETKVGRFQGYADALLLGCEVTRPIRGMMFDGEGGACAIGALMVGIGDFTSRGMPCERICAVVRAREDVCGAYRDRYHHSIAMDNDSGRFTREQIAARIAAL
jgi:hypothetical protein